MKIIFKIITISLFSIFIYSTHGQEPLIRYDFSSKNDSDNHVTITGGGFDSIPKATVFYDSLPVNNSFDGASDGHGALIVAAPGQGVMIFGEVINTENAALIRCSIRSNHPSVVATIATIDQSSSVFVSTNTINNGSHIHDRWRRLSLFFVPPSVGFQPVIQVINNSESESAIIYIDNFEIHSINPDNFYSGQFIDGDEFDPIIKAIPSSSIVNEAIPTSTPTNLEFPTNTPTHTPTITNMPTRIPTPTYTPVNTIPDFPSNNGIVGTWRARFVVTSGISVGSETLAAIQFFSNNTLSFTDSVLGVITGTYQYNSNNGRLTGSYSISGNSPNVGGRFDYRGSFECHVNHNLTASGSATEVFILNGQPFNSTSVFEAIKE